MTAPDPGQGGGGGAPEQGRAPPGAAAAAAGEEVAVDYAWLAEQLAELGRAMGGAALEDEDEDEADEWVDPSGGLLAAVYEACEEGDAAALEPLLERLKDSEWGVDAPGPDGDTALHLAALYGSGECVSLLLAAGAAPAAVNAEDGTTPIHDAAAGGYDSIIADLAAAARARIAAAAAALGSGSGGGEGGGEGGGGEAGAALAALLDLRDAEGETALYQAARGNHAAAVRLLLSLGASPAVAAADGSTAAEQAEDEEVAALLRGAGGGAAGARGVAAAAAAGGANGA